MLNLIAVETLDKDAETTGCQPVTDAPDGLWVALVERGGRCSFIDKVRNMQASGASAVIVGDNKKGGLVTMYARGKGSNCPCQQGWAFMSRSSPCHSYHFVSLFVTVLLFFLYERGYIGYPDPFSVHYAEPLSGAKILWHGAWKGLHGQTAAG